jgi:hypothetical protein
LVLIFIISINTGASWSNISVSSTSHTLTWGRGFASLTWGTTFVSFFGIETDRSDEGIFI